jgi:hypothetical protein
MTAVIDLLEYYITAGLAYILTMVNIKNEVRATFGA